MRDEHNDKFSTFPADSDDSSKRFHFDVEGSEKDVGDHEGGISTDEEGTAGYLVPIPNDKSFL